MKTHRLIWPALFMLLAVCHQASAGEDTHAGQAAKESAQASAHGSASAAHALIASGKATSAVASVPLAVGGSVLTAAGGSSTSAAKNLQQAASAPVGKPLNITDESVVTVPPDQALKR